MPGRRPARPYSRRAGRPRRGPVPVEEAKAVKRTEAVVIGGGQAGLAMSRCLSEERVDHVVLERGRVAERWRSGSWDSLRLLTPNWQSRLPGLRYEGAEPAGYMSMP